MACADLGEVCASAPREIERLAGTIGIQEAAAVADRVTPARRGMFGFLLLLHIRITRNLATYKRNNMAYAQ
jgi:hypothetical protein